MLAGRLVGVSLGTAVLMWGSGLLNLQPWIRELILGSETLSSPRTGQLLKVSRPLRSQRPGWRRRE